MLVTLTPAGHELVDRLVDRVLGREAELISILTAEQREMLTELLRLLLADLHARVSGQRPTHVGSSQEP